MHKLPNFIHEHPDVLQVILAHLGAVAISFTDVELFFKILSLVLASGYTLWKWIHEWKKTKKNAHKG